jgi:chromate reductase
MTTQRSARHPVLNDESTHQEHTMRIIGIAGSLRKQSLNGWLLSAATQLMPDGVSLEIGSIQDIPLYNFDVEQQGIPPAVLQLKDLIAGADGLLLVTPEYNNSMPGVLKNAIDWLSRPPADVQRVFKRRPVGIIGASPGSFGTILSQNAWLPTLRTLGTRPWFGSPLYVSAAHKAFDANGALTDVAIRERLQRYLEGLTEFVASSH